MQVYDWVVLALAAALAIRGWRRGLVREVVEIAVLVAGTAVVFRMSPAVGAIVSGVTNVSPEVARIVGGIVIFLALIVGSIIASKLISAALKVVPGATTLNRLGGAAVGVGYALFVSVVATTLLAAAPLPSSVRDSFDSSVGDSVVGSQIVSPDGVIQRTFSSVSGEDVFGAVIAVRDAVGDRLVAGTFPLPLPGVGDSRLVTSPTAAEVVFGELNDERISAGFDPLSWSSDLSIVSVTRATDVYRSGFLRLDDDLGAALDAEGIPGTITGEMLAIAATPHGLSEALVSAPSYQSMIVDPMFRKAGVGVVEGPYGLITVVVLSG